MVSDALVYRPVQARRHQEKPPVKYTYFYTERHMNAELALFFFLFRKYSTLTSVWIPATGVMVRLIMCSSARGARLKLMPSFFFLGHD